MQQSIVALIRRGQVLRKIHSSSLSSASASPPVSDSFAFSGCGWLTPYHLGAIQSLREEGYITKESVVAGSSGGSIAATLVSADICTHDAMKIISKLATSKEFNQDKDKGIRQVILDVLPDSDSYIQCCDKLHITVTQVSPTFIKRPLIISDFHSNEDLASAVSTSCFIPLWSNMRLTTGFRDTKAIDGGVFAFMPPVGKVTITPFPRVYSYIKKQKKRASISPLLLPKEKRLYSEARLGYWALDPPSPQVLQELYDYGARSADEWMKQIKLKNQRNVSS